MSDEIPTPDSAFEVSEEATDAATPGEGGPLDSPLVDGLLSTKPESNPTDPLEYYLSGLKKFANGALGAGLEAGTTAAEDFIRGTVGLLNGPDGDESNGQGQGQDGAESFDNEGWDNR